MLHCELRAVRSSNERVAVCPLTLRHQSLQTLQCEYYLKIYGYAETSRVNLTNNMMFGTEGGQLYHWMSRFQNKNTCKSKLSKLYSTTTPLIPIRWRRCELKYKALNNGKSDGMCYVKNRKKNWSNILVEYDFWERSVPWFLVKRAVLWYTGIYLLEEL